MGRSRLINHNSSSPRSNVNILTPTRKRWIVEFKETHVEGIGTPAWKDALLKFLCDKVKEFNENVELTAADIERWIKHHGWVCNPGEVGTPSKVDISKKVKKERATELEENDGWLRILGNEEILKKIDKAGISETRPLRGEICTIRIEGRLAEDESVVFEMHEKLTFQLGDAEVITGLDLAIPLMCKGEKASLKISPRFSYGSIGLEPKIPPNSQLLYEVELLDFKKEKDLSELTVSELRQIENRKRERGNFWHERGEASLASQCYRRTLEFQDAQRAIQFPTGEDPDKKITVSKEVKGLFDDPIKTLNNMAQAQLKLQDPDEKIPGEKVKHE